ncbi:hypothetical protein V8G54_035885 [Vigna mungo]|uniref:Protein kinase domain-containing protein n=1 Tax=Vigna mungo TaxID=3915 RepID=A0AAQ3RDS6_VIGMU
MSDDMLIHFSSNSSNQSDHSLPTKIAKLEARMVGKGSSTSSQQPGWSSVSVPSAGKFVRAVENSAEASTSSDSDDDNGGAFLIQANTSKRQKLQEDGNTSVFESVEVVTDGRQTSLDAVETKMHIETNRKKHGRGRGSSGSGRGRGSRVNDQTKTLISSPTALASNGQIDNVYHKGGKPSDQFHSDNCVSLEDEVASLQAKVVALEEELRKSKQEAVDYQNLTQQLEKPYPCKLRRFFSGYKHNASSKLTVEMKEMTDHEQQMKPKRMKVISDLLISVSKAERQEARLKVRQDSLRLGNVGVIRAGTVISETWEDGQALKDLNAQLELGYYLCLSPSLSSMGCPPLRVGSPSDWCKAGCLCLRGSAMALRVDSLSAGVGNPKNSYTHHSLILLFILSNNGLGPTIQLPAWAAISWGTYLIFKWTCVLLLSFSVEDKGDGTDAEAGLPEDILIHDEIYKCRLASLKRHENVQEEEIVLRERDRYEIEKGRLIREMKRIRDEDGSRFNNFQILNHRYALLNLLGKGGFSEVYKAFDLVDHRYVACKLHGLNAQWSEEKKQSYIRHAIREYNIHKTLVHRHIVRLWDIFEIDQNTFCTVLEYCSGKDLDAVLKATPILSEREAKPGNVLFDELGVAKVTDFGLSKIVEDDVGSQGMELTSQGAGTYWYLPPECFELSKTPLISSKVDVWSAGILYYQMLFGRRPFGHHQTQERILREDTIIKARKVDFPSKPTISNEAKELGRLWFPLKTSMHTLSYIRFADFIRRCLTYNQAERPDVLTIAQDPYLTFSKK